MITLCLVATAAEASWYWPFGGRDKRASRQRISTLMEPASLLIDTAADHAENDRIPEAVEEYRKALQELDRIELENPERAETPEFATLRNKRAYVNTAIDSLLLKQAQQNAKAVAVTDTTELEKKYAKLLAEKKAAKEPVKDAGAEAAKADEAAVAAELSARKTPGPAAPVADKGAGKKGAHAEEIAALLKKDPQSRKARLMQVIDDLAAKDYDAAELTIKGLLADRPNDAAALNLRAALESDRGDERAAEKTLDQAIISNPRSHYAYYNMARLFLRTRGAEGHESAKRYYKTGRGYGGPVDAELEKLFE